MAALRIAPDNRLIDGQRDDSHCVLHILVGHSPAQRRAELAGWSWEY